MAGCTCLHPGWPDKPCELHPDARPRTPEEQRAFALAWNALVDAGKAVR